MPASALPPDPSGIRHALIIKLRHHGDVLLTTPLFSQLKSLAPHCAIDALVYVDTAPMLAGHPAIDRIHTIERRQKSRSGPLSRVTQEYRLLQSLVARRYDLILHLTESWRGAWLARVLRPKYGVALVSPLQPNHFLWRSAFTHLAVLPPWGKRHTVERHLDTLRALRFRLDTPDRRLVFCPGETATQRVAALLSQHGIENKGFIHLHPTSRWMFKSWTTEGFAHVISALGQRGFRVIVTAGPDPVERRFAATILSRCDPTPVDLSGQLGLKELGAVIAAARLSICVDSAPMHLAAAVATPVVALFGPSCEKEWGPWQVPHRTLVSDHGCRPCHLDGCGGGKISECLTQQPPEKVLAAVESLLAETAGARP